MVGLDKFREAFEPFAENYVVIGGTACEIVMEGTAMRPRATHDIDMIIVVERMTAEFGGRFWQFIREAGYRPERSKGAPGEKIHYQLYRFIDGKPGYPAMIELLSRHPNLLDEPEGVKIEPIHIDENISSLSAIVMDDDFYNFTVAHSQVTDGVSHADIAALIALKASAYLNLLRDKAAGKHVNARDIKKHRSDVLKNVFIMTEDEIVAPEKIVAGIQDFVASIRNNWSELATPLAKSLDSEVTIVAELLDALASTFVTE